MAETWAQDSAMAGQRQKRTKMSQGNEDKTANRKLLFQETRLSQDGTRRQQVAGVWQHQREDPEPHVKDGAEEAENKVNSDARSWNDSKPCCTRPSGLPSLASPSPLSSWRPQCSFMAWALLPCWLLCLGNNFFSLPWLTSVPNPDPKYTSHLLWTLDWMRSSWTLFFIAFTTAGNHLFTQGGFFFGLGFGYGLRAGSCHHCPACSYLSAWHPAVKQDVAS